MKKKRKRRVSFFDEKECEIINYVKMGFSAQEIIDIVYGDLAETISVSSLAGYVRSRGYYFRTFKGGTRYSTISLPTCEECPNVMKYTFISNNNKQGNGEGIGRICLICKKQIPFKTKLAPLWCPERENNEIVEIK